MKTDLLSPNVLDIKTDKMSEEFGVIDYREEGHVIVEEWDENTYIVTLKMFFRVTDEKYTGAYDAESLCKKWCSNWDAETVAKDLDDGVDRIIHDAKWLEPGVLNMKINKPKSFSSGRIHDIEETTREFIYFDSLEDTVYEGCTDNNFWCIPHGFT